MKAFYTELDDLLRNGNKLLVHGEELGDRLVGIMGGYIRWSGLVEDDTKAIEVTERLTGRQLDPWARDVDHGRGPSATTSPEPNDPCSATTTGGD